MLKKRRISESNPAQIIEAAHSHSMCIHTYSYPENWIVFCNFVRVKKEVYMNIHGEFAWFTTVMWALFLGPGCGDLEIPNIPKFQATSWVHPANLRMSVPSPGHIELAWTTDFDSEMILVDVRTFNEDETWSDWFQIRRLSATETTLTDSPTRGIRQYRLWWVKGNRSSRPIWSDPIDADCVHPCAIPDVPLGTLDERLSDTSPRTHSDLDPLVASSIDAALTAEENVLVELRDTSTTIHDALGSIHARYQGREPLTDQFQDLSERVNRLHDNVHRLRMEVRESLQSDVPRPATVGQLDASLAFYEEVFSRIELNLNAVTATIESADSASSGMTFSRDQNQALVLDLDRQDLRFELLHDAIQSANYSGALTPAMREHFLLKLSDYMANNHTLKAEVSQAENMIDHLVENLLPVAELFRSLPHLQNLVLECQREIATVKALLAEAVVTIESDERESRRPRTPNAFRAVLQSDGNIRLFWMAPADSPDRYIVQNQYLEGNRWHPMPQLTVEDGHTAETTIIAADKRLRYRIKSVVRATSSDWSTGWRTVDNRLPATPEDTQGQVHRNGDITVTWSYESHQPKTGFEVRRKMRRTNGHWTNWRTIRQRNGNRSQMHDETVRSRPRVYRYQVRTLNRSGSSAWSDTVELDARRN